ncbi:MAG: alpha/beta fold hydrolase [Polyangiaceae bacterium]|nr:alpha/beta fold hydrolase [Polyangiaceae bacterium]
MAARGWRVLGLAWAVLVGAGACGSSGESGEVGFSEEAGGNAGNSQGGSGAGKGGKAGKGGAGEAGEAGAAGQDGGAGGGSGEGPGGEGPGGSGGQAGQGVEAKGAPYPIVLAHGFFGFEEFAGVNFITYFYKVKERLDEEGEGEVFTPAVDPFNNSEVRAQMLLTQVEEVLKQTGRARVNLIGHSQGGLDARIVAHLRPDLVASVTTFATPHRGTKIADVALGLIQDERAQDLLDGLVKLAGIPLYDAAGQQTSLSQSMIQLSTAEMEKFNAVYVDQPGIVYQSLTGRSKNHLGGSYCQSPVEPEFVKKTKSRIDGLEPLLTVPGLILDGLDLTPEPHDGLVMVESARWGQFLGCVPADHFDEIGHLFGDKAGLVNDWDHLDFYVELVKLLRQKGL